MQRSPHTPEAISGALGALAIRRPGPSVARRHFAAVAGQACDRRTSRCSRRGRHDGFPRDEVQSPGPAGELGRSTSAGRSYAPEGVPAMATPLFAVTPLVVAPLAVLAMLFPVLFAGPLRALRRWWVVFNVCSVSAALYTTRFTFQGVKRRLAESDAWWASPVAFWLALALVAAAGAMWVWWRHRAAGPAAPK